MTAPRDDSPTSTLTLASTAFRDGEPMPIRHTCDGEDLSPPLAWAGVPVGTRTFALICDDPDAPRRTWVHWLLWNLPSDAVELGEGVQPRPELPSGARQGLNDSGDLGYGGPCPPPGAPHRYFFRLHALDTSLNLPPGANRPELELAMEGHVLAHATIMGTYGRQSR
ncbi:MAG TPA: YbhB/YbcL family Raf kinase inhibitor-like protein [Gemmatimonadales bacterium]|nr:YbhB/YbcL family Raf kinase inhibitor-like protein [Gemmatimonadales bacterium]